MRNLRIRSKFYFFLCWFAVLQLILILIYLSYLKSHSTTKYKLQNEKSTNFTNGQVLENSCGYLVRKTPQGRLGSNMFSYASFYGIVKSQQKRMKKTAILQLSEISSSLNLVFENLSIREQNLSDSWFNQNNFTDAFECCGCCKYDSAINKKLSCDGKNVTIGGYRQSFKYFANALDEIKREFTFNASIRKICNRIFNNNLAKRGLDHKNCIVIGAHMRRGDFTLDKKIEFGHWPAQVDYLKKAIRYYEELIFYNKSQNFSKGKSTDCLVFLIIGNDYDWNLNATKQIELIRPKQTHLIVINGKYSEPAIDMCVMTLCDHTIISTGTFSWWCGFFSKGIVTRQKIYSRPNSSLFTQHDENDYFLPIWIAL